MSTFVLTDAAIERALAPDVHVAAPDDFTRRIAESIAPKPGQSRLWLLNPFAWPRHMTLATQMLLVLLLLLVLLVGVLVTGSLTGRGFPNGHVITVGSSGTTLLDIDPTTSNSARTLLTLEGGIRGGRIFGVTRSGDGKLISFWTDTSDGITLHIVDGNGGDARRVAANLIPSPIGQGQIDVWSPNGRSLAAGVEVDGEARILLVDVSSGSGELIGPTGASNPLWSPDGQLLAFSWLSEGRSVLAVMHPDGAGLDVVSGDLGDLDVSGANNWSPDGGWVYFGAERDSFMESNIFRANVEARHSEQLTFDILSAAPALSPDGTMVVYSYWRGGLGTQDLRIMEADGEDQHLLLAAAINDGWSNDGQFVLAEWRPARADSELLILRPDGTDRQTLTTFAGGCLSACAKDLAWGQPRP